MTAIFVKPQSATAEQIVVSQPRDSPDCAALVSRIRNGDAAAFEELYGIFARGVRYFLLRHLGPEEIDDKVHDCFVIVLQAIHDGELREPERLMGYVRTVVKRKISSSIDFVRQQRLTRVDLDDTLCFLSDRGDNPERELVSRQQIEIARKVFAGISGRDREILRRFYVLEQSQEQIRADMALSFNQFRLLKSRAKARFGEIGKRLAAGGGDFAKAS
jgi:RNA polymerase sigma-70 factor (ECF subfamily)